MFYKGVISLTMSKNGIPFKPEHRKKKKKIVLKRSEDNLIANRKFTSCYNMKNFVQIMGETIFWFYSTLHETERVSFVSA